MAIFSPKTEDQTKDKPKDKAKEIVDAPKIVAADGPDNTVMIGQRGVLIVPRLSEKSVNMNKLNKYVFKIEGKVNKVELKKAIEKAYGAKVAGINMITVLGKSRRYGKTMGKRSGFKKAIVTLTKDSKKIDTIQA